MPMPPPASTGWAPVLERSKPLPRPESTSSSVPGTQRTSSRVPSPTTFTSSIRAPSSVQLQMEMGRRRNFPGSSRLTNCPGAVMAEVSPESTTS